MRVQGSGFRVQGSGLRVEGAGFRVQGSGLRVEGAGFRVQFASPEAATLNPDRGVHREGHIACTMLRLMCTLDPERLHPEPWDTGVTCS